MFTKISVTLASLSESSTRPAKASKYVVSQPFDGSVHLAAGFLCSPDVTLLPTLLSIKE